MFEKKGLRYRILDSNGKRIGVPIKASTIRSKPTLSRLERQFRKHEEEKPKYKDAVIKAINDSFRGRGSLTKSAFVQALSKEGIYTLFRQNEEGRIYGITFVDNKNKVVFNGSDLGKSYSAKALTERLTSLSTPDPKVTQPASPKSERNDNDAPHARIDQPIKDLMEAKQYDFTSPDAATKRRRKKRKRGHSI
jgi:hypothetical protein